jgi:hypothetical protein
MSGRDLGASVRQRLLNQARSHGRPFQELLQYFAMERFLYRLAKSPFADRFVLKGALLLTAWKAPVARPTMDIDLAGKTSNELEDIRSLVGDVCEFATDRGHSVDLSTSWHQDRGDASWIDRSFQRRPRPSRAVASVRPPEQIRLRIRLGRDRGTSAALRIGAADGDCTGGFLPSQVEPWRTVGVTPTSPEAAAVENRFEALAPG